MDFKELGLTANEAKAYELMLRVGKTTAAHISKESGVPYGRIYNVLDSLEEKGLIKIVPEETKKYVPSDPEKLHEAIDKKIKSLNEIKNKVKDLKKLYEEKNQQPIFIAQGKSNFHKIAYEMKSAKHYSYAIKYTFDTDPRFMEGARRHKKEGVDRKTLGRFSKETEKPIKIWRKLHNTIKPIPNEGVAIGIVDDEELLIGMIQSNTTILIRDKPTVKMMKELFLRYYNTQP